MSFNQFLNFFLKNILVLVARLIWTGITAVFSPTALLFILFYFLINMRDSYRPFMRKFRDWADKMSDDDFCSPEADIFDKDDMLVIRIDMPGIEKEDIKLNVNGDMIEVKAEKTEENNEEEGEYYLSERYFKGFYRKISLPKTIVPEDAKAKFRNGVLEITAPKFEEESSEIEIED